MSDKNGKPTARLDYDDEWDDGERNTEPVGSCEWCSTNLYEWDDSELCDQCLYHTELNGGLDENGEDEHDAYDFTADGQS